jgi:hypothetical protein
MNNDSIQAQGLRCWWPFWEPQIPGQAAPMAMEYGKFGLHFYPSANTNMAPDPIMGTCWTGVPNPMASASAASIAGIGSGQVHYRLYAAGVAGQIDPVDFGNYSGVFNFGQSHMTSAWFRTDALGTSYTTSDNPPDQYIYTFDRGDNVDFPGYSLATITQIPNLNPTPVAAACATIFDNGVNSDKFGVSSLRIVNDGQWHLVVGIYVPNAINGAGGGQQWILVDGDIGFVGGVDTGASGTQPFGRSGQQNSLGSPQDSSHAVVVPPDGKVYHIVGSDDDGVNSAFQGSIADHRVYVYPEPPSIATNATDQVQFWMSLAAHMYAPETRWELYQAAPAKQTYFLPLPPPPAPSGWQATFPDMTGTRQTMVAF